MRRCKGRMDRTLLSYLNGCTHSLRRNGRRGIVISPVIYTSRDPNATLFSTHSETTATSHRRDFRLWLSLCRETQKQDRTPFLLRTLKGLWERISNALRRVLRLLRGLQPSKFLTMQEPAPLS